MQSQSPLLNILNKSIRNSGKKIIRDFCEIEKLQNSIKQIEKFINISKNNLEKDILNLLEKLRPELKVLKKNDTNEKDSWIVNLIDSETNFSRGIDNFFINVSLKKLNKTDLSVLYNPVKDENYYFQKGLGGYKNDFRIRVSEKKRISKSIISFYCKTNESNENLILGNIRQILRASNIETRESGSLSNDICLLACGKIECVMFFDKDLFVKDQINLILAETGGFLNKIIVDKKEICLASNKYIGKILKEMIENKYEIH